MATQVDLYNRALAKLGSQPCVTVSDTREDVRVLNRLYEFARDAELRKNNWNFSIKRDSLSADGTDPSWGYLSRFALPSDCVRIIEIDGYTGVNEPIGSYGRAESDYTLEGGYILCDDDGPIDVRYVEKVTSVSRFDSLFFEALACKMAFEGCEAILSNSNKKEQLLRDYEDAIKEARRVDAIETPGDPLYEDDWLTARL